MDECAIAALNNRLTLTAFIYKYYDNTAKKTDT